MVSTTDGATMVSLMFTSTGQFFTDMLPLLYLFFGTFIAFYFLITFTRALRGGIKGAGK